MLQTQMSPNITTTVYANNDTSIWTIIIELFPNEDLHTLSSVKNPTRHWILLGYMLKVFQQSSCEDLQVQDTFKRLPLQIDIETLISPNLDWYVCLVISPSPRGNAPVPGLSWLATMI